MFVVIMMDKNAKYFMAKFICFKCPRLFPPKGRQEKESYECEPMGYIKTNLFLRSQPRDAKQWQSGFLYQYHTLVKDSFYLFLCIGLCFVIKDP